MTLLLLSACFSGPNPLDEDGIPDPAPELQQAAPAFPLSQAPPGMTNLCVTAASGFEAPAASWMFMSGDGTMAQVDLKTPWGANRCGLIQTLYVKSGLQLRSQDQITAGTVGGLSYRFNDGSAHGSDAFFQFDKGPGTSGYLEARFGPLVPPGE